MPGRFFDMHLVRLGENAPFTVRHSWQSWIPAEQRKDFEQVLTELFDAQYEAGRKDGGPFP